MFHADLRQVGKVVYREIVPISRNGGDYCIDGRLNSGESADI